MKKNIFILLIIIVGVVFFVNMGLSNKPVFNKQGVYPGVDVKIQINKVVTKVLMGESYSFVYFLYTIQNQHPKKIYFDPGNIRVNYNGLINQSVEYDSLASAMTEAEELPTGTKEYALYFVFDQPNVSKNISQFEILNAGVGAEKGDK